VRNQTVGLMSVFFLILPTCTLITSPGTGVPEEQDSETGGRAGSGGSGGGVSVSGSGGTGVDDCPPAPPADASACDRVGLRCGYGDALIDYLCTSAGTWKRRVYTATVQGGAGGSSGAAGAAGTGGAITQPPLKDCGSYSMSACPIDQCEIGCCAGGGDDSGGCAGCCNSKACTSIAPSDCPIGACQLVTGCDGSPLCFPAFTGSPPICGTVSYYGAQVACCEGLSARCGALVFGVCDPNAGGYNGVPMCLACGDRTCEKPFENPCNCPEDCVQ
jgi:hypothetical protein